MRSIQFRLSLRLTAFMLALSLVGSIAVFFVFRAGMINQFDQGLQSEAHAIATLFVRASDGRYVFRPPPDFDRMFHHGHDQDAFCIRGMDGTVVVKARWLGKLLCPGLGRTTTYEGYDHVFEPGHDADHYWRAIFLTFTPAAENGRKAERFQIIVAAEREEIGHLLENLLSALALVALAAGAATVLLVVWTVQRDLSPLRELARQAGAIDSTRMGTRFALTDGPRELDPIRRALNGLLDRMEAALKREQRFNADVAHELRTPVAELRSLAEVALSSPENRGRLAEALADARDIGAQMENLIAALLALRRREAATLQRLDVVPLVHEAWRSAQSLADERALAVTWQLPDEAPAVCDPIMLASVLRNLFENAARYTRPGGQISCAVERHGAAIVIALRNRPHDLMADDVAHLFEPFWRKEQARSDGAHVGLGLALAESYCRSFDAELRAALEDGGWIAFTITIGEPPAAGASPASVRLGTLSARV